MFHSSGLALPEPEGAAGSSYDDVFSNEGHGAGPDEGLTSVGDGEQATLWRRGVRAVVHTSASEPIDEGGCGARGDNETSRGSLKLAMRLEQKSEAARGVSSSSQASNDSRVKINS